MKKIMKTFLVLTASAVLWAGQANAVLINIVPSTVGPLVAGETFTVDIIASDFGADEYITAYDILVAFDPLLLAVDFVQWSGTELGGCFVLSDCDADFDDLALGLVGAAELSFLFDWEFPDFQDGSDFSLFAIGFRALEDLESTDLSFVWDEFHDVKCTDADQDGFADVCAPTSVPEPGTLSLLGLGLLALGVTRRRRKLH